MIGMAPCGVHAPPCTAPTTTIGFGKPADGNGKTPVTGFAPSSGLPVKDLGVVGRGAKRVRLD